MLQSVTYLYSNVFYHTSRRKLLTLYIGLAFGTQYLCCLGECSVQVASPKHGKCVTKLFFSLLFWLMNIVIIYLWRRRFFFFSFQSSVLRNFVESELIITKWKKKRVYNKHFLSIFVFKFTTTYKMSLLYSVYW